MVGAPPLTTRPGELVREAAMPYRTVFDVVWSGRRHIMMMASQIDRTGNQNISAIGTARPAQGPARRRARRPGQLGQPPHQLLGARPHRAHLRRAGRRGLRRRLRPGRRGRARGHPLPRRRPRRLQPRRVRLRDARPHHAPALAPPRASPSTRSWPPPASRWPSPTTWPRPASRRPRSSSSSATCSTRARCATARCGPERRRRRRAGAAAPGAPHRAVRAGRRALPAGADRHGLGGRARGWSPPPARPAGSASWPRPP